METHNGPFGIEFIKIPSGTCEVGTNKGGWIYASERPRYRASLPSYSIMKAPVTLQQAAEIFDEDKPENNHLLDNIDHSIIEEISRVISKNSGFEVRPPSHAEWLRAEELYGLDLPCGFTEVLSDFPHANYRGAPLDGRPRTTNESGAFEHFKSAIACHPKKNNLRIKSHVSVDRPQKEVVFRLVMVQETREETCHYVPDGSDLRSNIIQESIWITLLGIIPSFTIPILRGFSDYAVDGWVNLLFGGLCIGFVSGAFWRPKTKTYEVDANGELTSFR